MKATGDVVSGDLLKLLGVDELKLMTQMIKNKYEIGEWPIDFNDVTMTALKKKPEATKCSDYHKISLILHTAN